MKKYILAYMEEVRAFLGRLDADDAVTSEEMQGFLKEFEVKITYFQHERLIHLIVTVLFALLEISSVYMILAAPSLSAGILCLMFLVLLVPYIAHYYFLENSVQEMYKMRDEIVSRIRSRD